MKQLTITNAPRKIVDDILDELTWYEGFDSFWHRFTYDQQEAIEKKLRGIVEGYLDDLLDLH